MPLSLAAPVFVILDIELLLGFSLLGNKAEIDLIMIQLQI